MIEVKDIIVLRFLDQHLEASKILGSWYLDSLSKGVTHEILENYIFDQWLQTVGYNQEQINFLKDEYIKYESHYAQSLLDGTKDIGEDESKESVKDEQTVLEQVEIPVTENTQSIQSTQTCNIGEFLFKNLDIQFHSFLPELVKWLDSVDIETGKNYIFSQWLPSFLPAEQVQNLINLYNNIPLENALPLEVLEIKVIEVEDKVEALLGNIDSPSMAATLQPSDNQVGIQTEESEYQKDAVSTLTEVESNLANMRKLEKEIQEKIDNLLLLKEPYKIGNSYINDNYKHCPSFNNLIPQIQKAIIVRREQKANEKWFEKYRPELVEEILFPNQTIKETITEYVDNKHIAGNCMFYGTGGVGKTTTNIVLMNSILQNAADRFFLDRKIESVDELKGWLTKKPYGKQKIVIAEEFDRLSDAAMTELKNGLMEKYEYVVFLASTNKIHKIDEALLTRFTLISKFDTAQVSDITNKCRYILTNERIQFSEQDLAYFVEQNKLKGIRTILNNLQLSCYKGLFEPKRTAFFIGDSGTEFDMINSIKWYINYLIQLPKENLWYLSYDLNQDQNVAKVRGYMLETLLSNYSLNYDYIFMELLKDNIFLPIKNCINEYYQDIDLKRIKPMHFEAMLNEFITIFYATKDVYNR